MMTGNCLMFFHHFENSLLNGILNWYLYSLLMCNFMVTWFHSIQPLSKQVIY